MRLAARCDDPQYWIGSYTPGEWTKCSFTLWESRNRFWIKSNKYSTNTSIRANTFPFLMISHYAELSMRFNKLWTVSLLSWKLFELLQLEEDRTSELSAQLPVGAKPWASAKVRSNGFETSQVGKVFSLTEFDRSQNLSSRTLCWDLRQKLNNLAWPKLSQPRLKYELRVTQSTWALRRYQSRKVCSASNSQSNYFRPRFHSLKASRGPLAENCQAMVG